MNALASTAENAPNELEIAREAQRRWAMRPWRERLPLFRRLREEIAENGDALARAIAALNDRPAAEKLMAEVLPLAEACHWLARHAERVLAPRREGRWSNPLWLHGISLEVQRRPFGLVLVIGPRNYPLFLPAVQTLQAIAAGNAVLLKPAPGTRSIALAFARLLQTAGFDAGLLMILPEEVAAAQETIRRGVDKVVFTGSSSNGRSVLDALAARATPAVMELSGRDAVVVLADADLDLVVRALRFGHSLNGGETCIAPRRLVVEKAVAEKLLRELSWVDREQMAIERVPDAEAALHVVNADRFGLGASIFSRDLARARDLAGRCETGCVTINDLIVPTADPRLPFGGTKASGFGSTRGPEGLLEMTYPHAISIRHGKARPHLREVRPNDYKLFTSYLRLRHGRRRLAAGAALFRALRRRRSSRFFPVL